MGGRKIYFTPYNQDNAATLGSALCRLTYSLFVLVLIAPQSAWAADLVPVQTAPGTNGTLLAPPAAPGTNQPETVPPPMPPPPAAPAPRAAPGTNQPETVPPPTPPRPAAPTPPPRPGQMLFNFQDADIQAVVKTVSQISGRNFLLDPRVKGKITIISAKPVSANAAYQIFLSALKAQGFTAVEGPGGIVKILPEAEAKQNATVSSASQPAGGDQLVTQVVVVQHGSASQMVPLLRPLMAPTGLLSVYAPANTLIITDYADNVRRSLQIIEKLDQPGSAEVTIIPLQYASALDMAQLLVRLSDVAQPGQPVTAGQIGGEAGRLSIVPDLRSNSLLVRTDNQGRLNQLRALVAKLDVPAHRGGNTRVVYLRNAEAAKLAEILRGLLAGEARAQGTLPGAVGGPIRGAGAASSVTEASLIQADEASNSLIISAPDAVYNNLRAVIEKLDIRRAQVFIEAMIAEMTTDLAAEFGFQWAGAKAQGSGTLAGVQNFPQSTPGSGIIEIGTNPASLGNGLSIAYLGKTITLPGGQQIAGLGALARALASDSNTNILSTPNLLTLDNAEAKIIVAKNVPFLTGSFAQAAGAVPGAAVNPFQTIERKDVGLTLKIKPQISEGEGVKLQIFEENSTINNQVNTGGQGFVTNKRSVETTVIVDNGQTIVLGGLIDDQVTETIQAVPILSRIPILGELFKFRSRTKTKTNLMVFLRPIIVRSPQDSEGFTAERYEYIRGQQQNMQMQWTVIPRYENPVLPPLVQPSNDQPKVKGKEEDRPGSADRGTPSSSAGPPDSDKTPDSTEP